MVNHSPDPPAGPWRAARARSTLTALAVVLIMSLPGCGEGPTVPEEQSEPESGTEAASGSEPASGTESGTGSEPGESGTQYKLSDTARQSRSGVNLVIGYDAAAQSFTGTVTNTTTAVVSLVRVEVHLSNGIELGPTPSLNLTPAQTSPVALSADGQQFTTWSVHVEIGEDEH